MGDINFKGHISIDCVIIRYYNNELQVLIDKSEEEIRHHALVTHLTDTGESIEELVTGKLFDLVRCESTYVEQFQTFTYSRASNSKKDRKTNKSVVIIGAFALIVSPAEKLDNNCLRWIPISEVGELVSIHNRLLQGVLTNLRNRIVYEPIVYHLLPEKFSLNDLQQIYEIILGISLDKRNFRKKISHLKYLVPLNEKQKNVRHKPARLYSFNRTIYYKNK